ncbi:hypothetical protein OG552_00220 [Streptomyces sp. NBC_01476]|uniref:hypothetical protein n=1 Tax=Streptomyces sp. NBC_01476 TaxID=2903881 RepID=UPI002E322BE1|nr:hypothetical protein [Streptomyces sp. NBC_01476]
MTTPSSTTTAPARFLLLGDSHAGPVGRAAHAAGIAFQGGPLGAGREFTGDFFTVAVKDVVFRKQESDAYYRGFLAALDTPALGALTVPLVSTFGLCAHFVATAANWRIHRLPAGPFAPGFLGSALFDAIVLAMVGGAVDFYRHALGLGLRVLAVMPPQRVPDHCDPLVFAAAQESIRTELVRVGVEMVDLRARSTGPDGLQRPEFCEADDAIHGNLAFGRLILSDLLARGL